MPAKMAFSQTLSGSSTRMVAGSRVGAARRASVKVSRSSGPHKFHVVAEAALFSKLECTGQFASMDWFGVSVKIIQGQLRSYRWEKRAI